MCCSDHDRSLDVETRVWNMRGNAYRKKRPLLHNVGYPFVPARGQYLDDRLLSWAWTSQFVGCYFKRSASLSLLLSLLLSLPLSLPLSPSLYLLCFNSCDHHEVLICSIACDSRCHSDCGPGSPPRLCTRLAFILFLHLFASTVDVTETLTCV